MKTHCTVSPRGCRRGVGTSFLATGALSASLLLAGPVTGAVAQEEGPSAPQEERPGAASPGTEAVEVEGSETRRQGEERPARERPGKPRLPEWRMDVTAGNQAELEVSKPSGRDLRVAIANAPTGLPWHIRLAKGPFSVDADELYRVEFRGRSDGVRSLGMSVIQLRPPFKNLSANVEVEVTPMWRTYRSHFKVPKAEDRARLQFFVGGSRHSLELADVTVVRVADGTDVLTLPFVPQPVEPREEPGAAPSAESPSAEAPSAERSSAETPAAESGTGIR